MQVLIFIVALFVAVPAYSQVTEDGVIQEAIDELQVKRDAINDNKVAIDTASQNLNDRITAIQAVADRPNIGIAAKAHCEKMLKKLQRIDIPNTVEVDTEIAVLDALITELQEELS